MYTSVDLNLLAKFLYFCDSSWLVSAVYQIEFRPLSPPHLKSPGPPVSPHRCVSLNLFLWRWWGIWPAAGLFPKTHYPLDLDLLLNSMNLALCESGCDYSCKGCKYCCFKGGKLWADYPLWKSGVGLPFISSFLPVCLSCMTIRPLLLQTTTADFMNTHLTK